MPPSSLARVWRTPLQWLPYPGLVSVLLVVIGPVLNQGIHAVEVPLVLCALNLGFCLFASHCGHLFGQVSVAREEGAG